MSYDGGDVFTMMIKQDSRDSNVYDAPAFIPDIQVQLLLSKTSTVAQDYYKLWKISLFLVEVL